MGVKSPSEFIELSTAQMRKQFDISSAQSAELCALAQQVATEATKPIKTGMSKALNKAISSRPGRLLLDTLSLRHHVALQQYPAAMQHR
jgi:Phasin protein